MREPSTRLRPGCCWCCPGPQLGWLRASWGWTSGMSRTSTSPARRRPETSKATGSSRTSRPRRTSSRSRSRLRGSVELPIPAASAVKVGGERAYRLARRGIEVQMPRRRSQVHALEVISYSGSVARLELHVGSGTYVRAIATALGGHCLALRRTAVGPFAVDEAVPPPPAAAPSLLPVQDALARLPGDALRRVPAAVAAGVLALANGHGAGTAA